MDSIRWTEENSELLKRTPTQTCLPAHTHTHIVRTTTHEKFAKTETE